MKNQGRREGVKNALILVPSFVLLFLESSPEFIGA